MSDDFEEEFEDYDYDEELSEDDFIDDNEDEDVGEYIALPFFSIFVTELPDKHNPVEMFKKERILLYNPLNKIQKYRKISPEGITPNLLKSNLIITNSKLSDSNSLKDLSAIGKVMNKNKDLMAGFDKEVEKDDKPRLRNTPKPKI